MKLGEYGLAFFPQIKLSSDELKSFKLEYGSNEAKFSVTTKFQ
uniref:Uncharacterized protein n=1 Tax=Panagrolaimus sp. ES5 TaxID=591445 RepID=A0AC34GBH1_9BILA